MELMTVADVAQKLKISRWRAYMIFHEPDFPLLRIGRSLRVRRDDFEKWLSSKKSAK